MADITYIGPAGGDWDDAANWSGGVVPGQNDTVTINGPGPAVNLDGNSVDRVDDVTQAPGSTLSIVSGDRLSIQGNYDDNGTTTIDGTGRIGIGGTVSGDGTIDFTGSGGAVLDIDTAQTVSLTLDGLTNGDRIALSGADLNGTLSFDQASGVLTYADGDLGTYTFAIQPGADISFNAVASVANPGLGIDLLVACYVAGTGIRTPSGDVAVEQLAIGDLVTTVSGEQRRIKWIGQRSYAGRFLLSSLRMQPIMFRAGSLADNVPMRDLLVSPKHAMFLDGVLVPAEVLVNGVSVVRCTDREQVDYYHVELDTHDVLLAEGAPSESFIDDGSRGIFRNAAEFERLYPGVEASIPDYCAPRIEDGELVEAIRRRIAIRANIEPDKAPLAGHLDTVQLDRVTGWAQDQEHREAAVCLDIYDNDVLVTRTLANRYRPDLQAAGFGSGRHGFDVALNLSPLETHSISVRRSSDGAELIGSPVLVESTGPMRAVA